MKDYTVNKEEKEKFILNYKIIDGQIIMNLASGKTSAICYTKENEKKVLTKMVNQVLNSDITKINSNLQKKHGQKIYKLYRNTNIVCLVTSAAAVLSFPVSIITSMGLLTITAVYRKRQLDKIKQEKKKVLSEKTEIQLDIIKNKTFLENKAKYDKVMDDIEDKPNLTINDMDKFNKNQIDKIVETINEIYSMEDEVKPKVTKMKKA